MPLAKGGAKGGVGGPCLPRDHQPLGDITNSTVINLTGDDAPPAPPTGTKRPAPNDEPDHIPGVCYSPISSSDDDHAIYITENPDQIRRKIHRVIDNKELKVGEFCGKIGVSNNAYNRFMKQSGKTKGMQSDVFVKAARYFQKREMRGEKLPTAQTVNKKAKLDAAAKDEGKGGKGAKSGKDDVDISDIHLDGEEHDAVPVYDTCDEVRRKITQHLQKPGVTQAQFCRDMDAQTHTGEPGQGLKSAQLTRFRGNTGAIGGAKSKVFYAAYVVFEKRRIKEGKPKSKKRQEMEDVWGKHGIDRDHDSNQRYLCAPGKRPHTDKYGKVSFH